LVLVLQHKRHRSRSRNRSRSRDRSPHHNSNIDQLPDLGSLSPFHSEGSDVDRSEY
jgi:hypothetical protein